MMLEALAAIIAIVMFCGFSLTIWRRTDIRGDKKIWAKLASSPSLDNEIFDQKMVADAPEPARRFFTYMIDPGARLYRTVSLEMRGELGMETKKTQAIDPSRQSRFLRRPTGLCGGSMREQSAALMAH